MRCRIHKRYKGKLRPRCDCYECWKIFVNKTDYQTICHEIYLLDPDYDGQLVLQDGIGCDSAILGLLKGRRYQLEKNNE